MEAALSIGPKGRADEYPASYWATQARSFSGQWDESNAHWRRATDLALRAEAKEVVASYTAEQALRAAWLRQFSNSLMFAQSALKTERNRTVLTRAALAFALAGEIGESAGAHSGARAEASQRHDGE